MGGTTNDPVPIDALLAAIQTGDERAVGLFVARYEPMIRRVLRVTGVIRWLQSQLESQDLVQSVFIQAVAAIRYDSLRFRDEAALEGFLRTVGRNRLPDHVRRLKAARRNRQRTIAGSPEALSQLADASPSPSQIAEVREEAARVAGCTTPSELKVLRDRAEGADWKQLAEERQTTPDALRKRIERIRQRIRDALAE
jgi:RNA polymerase sigma factor (sigma-70 family)